MKDILTKEELKLLQLYSDSCNTHNTSNSLIVVEKGNIFSTTDDYDGDCEGYSYEVTMYLAYEHIDIRTKETRMFNDYDDALAYIDGFNDEYSADCISSIVKKIPYYYIYEPVAYFFTFEEAEDYIRKKHRTSDNVYIPKEILCSNEVTALLNILRKLGDLVEN